MPKAVRRHVVRGSDDHVLEVDLAPLPQSSLISKHQLPEHAHEQLGTKGLRIAFDPNAQGGFVDLIRFCVLEESAKEGAVVRFLQLVELGQHLCNRARRKLLTAFLEFGLQLREQLARHEVANVV